MITASGTRLAKGHFDLNYHSTWNYDELRSAVTKRLQDAYQVCLHHFHLQARADGTKSYLLIKPQMIEDDEIGLRDGKVALKITLKS